MTQPRLLEVGNERRQELSTSFAFRRFAIVPHSYPGFDERTQQPWPDGPLVVAAVALRDTTFNRAAARTHGQIGYPGPSEKFGSLTGAPVLEKFVGYAPVEDIGRCKDCAKLFIIAEKEELFDNKEHAILAHERATGVKKLITIKGIKHYGIYNEARDQAQKEAIAWFDEHLKR